MSCIDYSKLDHSLALSKYILSNSYLQNLSSLPLHDKPCSFSLSHLQLLKLSSSVQYIPLPNSMMPLLTGLQSLCVTFCYIIHVASNQVSTYIGVSHPTNSLSGIEILKEGLLVLDPSLSLELIPQSEIQCLLEDYLMNTSLYNAITSTTFYPLTKTLTQPFSQLLQQLPGENYTILCIGEPLEFTSYLCLQREILQLSTALYPFREITHACTTSSNSSTNTASSHAHHEHESLTCGDNCSTTLTKSLTDTCTKNQSTPVRVSDKLSLTVSTASTHTLCDTDSKTNGLTNSKATQSICIKSVSDSNTESTTNTHLTNHREFNSEVERLILECANLFDFYSTNLIPPVFQFATYFLAPSIATSVRAAAYYMNSFTHTIPSTYPQYLNTWNKSSNSFCSVVDYLSHFSHPLFNCSCYKKCITPTLPWPASAIAQII